MNYACPCCGSKTLPAPPPGTFHTCEVCGWEDDFVQFDDPDFRGGANEPSLREAQQNYSLLGTYDPGYVKVRPPSEEEMPDPDWTPLT
jgi:hypothetical protein